MPWSPFSHVPKKTGREGTPESESGKSARKRKRPSYLQEFDIVADLLDDQSTPRTPTEEPLEATPKPKEIEKETKRNMPSIQENSANAGDKPKDKSEFKVKAKSSYIKLISNLQTTYPDLNHDDALRGILALRVQNNGTLTGMTMLEIMERVIKLVKPDKVKSKQEPKSKELKKPVKDDSTIVKKIINSEPEEEEAEEASTEDLKLTPSKKAQVDIERLVIAKPTPASPKTPKTYSRKSKQVVEEEEDENTSKELQLPEESETESIDKLLEDDTMEEAIDEEVQETMKKTESKEKFETSRTASKARGRKKEMDASEELIDEEKAAESDESFNPDPPKKSPKAKNKSTPKKMKDTEKETAADSDETGQVEKNEKLDTPNEVPKPRSRSRKKEVETSEEAIDEDQVQETPKKTTKKKEKLETPKTASKQRGKKKEIVTTEELIDEEKAEESDESFNPDPPIRSPKAKKKSSPQKKKGIQVDDQNEVTEAKETKKTSSPKKKEEKPKISNVESTIEETEVDQPRTSRKRKIPSYLKEFEIPIEDTKESTQGDAKKDSKGPVTPKPKSAKRKRVDSPKSPKIPKSSHKKKIIVPHISEHGECLLCGLMFDEESTKFGMSDKTRETGQTFADILFGLFHEESLPPSLAEKAKAVDLDMGSLCTLCVSHVDQLDVFQQKVTDIKTSIISIFIQKTRNDSLNQGEIESGDSDSEEEEKVEIKATPKKKGKKSKGKGGKLVTLVYQSPLKKVRDLDAMSEKDILKMTETVIKYTPKKSTKKEKAAEKEKEITEAQENEEETTDAQENKEPTPDPKPDPDLVQKLNALNGIEIKRINSETGNESDATLAIAGLAGIEIRRISDTPIETETPKKGKKTPKKEKKTPAKKNTPAKKKTPKKAKHVEITGQPVFEEACEELQNDLSMDIVNGQDQENTNENKLNEAKTPDPITSPPQTIVPRSPGNIARGNMRPNIPIRGGPIRMSPARGSPRGGIAYRGGSPRFQRGGMTRGVPRPNMNFRPAPPKSKKSLFELSQNKRKIGSLVTNHGISISPQTPAENSPVINASYRLNGLQVTSTPISSLPAPITPSKLNGLHSIQVSSASFTISPMPVTPQKDEIQAPAEVKEKKAYKKLISKIQAVHPDMSHEEAMRGIVALRTENNGTLTGMSMQEIITKVRSSVRGDVELPVGEEFEKIVNAAPAAAIVCTPTKVVDPATLYEIKCKFCSRLFKSSSETATKKVYEIHIQEHEKETRSIFEKETTETEVTLATAPEVTPAAPAEVTLAMPAAVTLAMPATVAVTLATPAAVPAAVTLAALGLTVTKIEDPDPVKREISYCKLCQKQFKSAKLYGMHQNTEHAAETEFEKLMSSP